MIFRRLQRGTIRFSQTSSASQDFPTRSPLRLTSPRQQGSHSPGMIPPRRRRPSRQIRKTRKTIGNATQECQRTNDAQASLISSLPDGTRMIWERAPGPLPANQLLWFKFRLEDANGKPVANLEPYMGMAGHAEFVRSDLSVFAHVHPDGSVPMAAVQLADATLAKNSAIPASSNPSATNGNEHARHGHYDRNGGRVAPPRSKLPLRLPEARHLSHFRPSEV